jgi:hypothetical protein
MARQARLRENSRNGETEIPLLRDFSVPFRGELVFCHLPSVFCLFFLSAFRIPNSEFKYLCHLSFFPFRIPAGA